MSPNLEVPCTKMRSFPTVPPGNPIFSRRASSMTEAHSVGIEMAGPVGSEGCCRGWVRTRFRRFVEGRDAPAECADLPDTRRSCVADWPSAQRPTCWYSEVLFRRGGNWNQGGASERRRVRRRVGSGLRKLVLSAVSSYVELKKINH